MNKPPLHLLPAPQQVVLGAGRLRLPTQLRVAGCGRDPIYPSILRELFARASTGGEVILLPAGDSPSARQPEGYALEVDAHGVRIHASQPVGHLYGALTLRQLRQQFGSRLPCCRIGDAPLLRRRGQQLSLVQGHTAYRPEYLCHLVPQLARWKINELYIYLETAFAFPSLPGVGGLGAMTPADARALRELCRAYGMKLIPMLNLLGHGGELLALQRYHHLQETDAQQEGRSAAVASLCPSLPEMRRVVAAQLRDTVAAFQPELIHVGGDEVGELGLCPRCAPRAAQIGKLGIYLQHFDWIRRLAAEHGCQIGIWGDMLLHYKKELNRPANRRLVQQLRQGAVLFDWHYDGGAPKTAKFFVRQGFETIVCSSTHCCFSASVWLAQAENQRLLFRDGTQAGVTGGLTTSWFNTKGLHEEHCNYLFATGAAMLWSGVSPRKGEISPGLNRTASERAYNRQRYGTSSTALTDFWHHLGDAGGPVLSPLVPLNAANLRECLYHTDNPLTFWRQYAALLAGKKLAKYRAAVREARRLWRRVDTRRDPYLPLQEGPLLMHEHLLQRYETAEDVFVLYDAAARHQYRDAARFRRCLTAAARRLEKHLNDYPPVLDYLARYTRQFGLETYSAQRVQSARRKTRELAAFLRSLRSGLRALPAFYQLESVFLGEPQTHYWIDREHEWTAGPKRFRRFSRFPSAWDVEWQYTPSQLRSEKEIS